MNHRMTPNDYSQFWDQESTQFQSDAVYERLSQIAPAESTLEIGCGAGWSTLSLTATRKVLAADNNMDLIQLARVRLQANAKTAQIIHSDLFEPTTELITAITSFEPKVIIGWFIGSHPDDNDKRTPAHLAADEKPKVYRESVEDRLVVPPLCHSSVEWIHTAQRGMVPPGVTESQIKQGMKEEYEKYMFESSGFTVTDVQVLDWNQRASLFPYVMSPNPDLPLGKPTPVIISILARRSLNAHK